MRGTRRCRNFRRELDSAAKKMGRELTLVLVVVGYLSRSSVVSGQLSCDPAASSELGASCVAGRTCRTTDYNTKFSQCFPGLEDPNLPPFCPDNHDCSGGAGGSTAQQVQFTIDDFDPRFEPVDFNRFNLSVRLPVPGVQYDLRVTVTGDEDYCACTSASSHNFTLLYNPTAPESSLTIKAIPGDAWDWSFSYPTYCADQVRYDSATCGLPLLQKPTSLILHCNTTHTSISWNKTVSYSSPVDNQDVRVNVSTFYLRVHTCDSKTSEFEVKHATEVTLNTPAVLGVSFYAYHKCSGLYDRKKNSTLVPYAGCSEPAHCSDATSGACCGETPCNPPPPVTLTSVVSTPLHTTIVSSPEPDGHHFLPVYIAAGVAGGILVVVATVVVVIFTRRCQPKRNYWRLIRQSSPSPFQQSALIIYSPSTPKKDKHVILQSFDTVQNRVGIECVLEDKRKPRQSLVDWISDHYEKAGTVFCICNKEFQCDWENERPSSEGSAVAVQTLRLLFEGALTSTQLHKYAVVLCKPADKAHIPSLLKALHRIDLSDTSALIQFAGREASPV